MAFTRIHDLAPGRDSPWLFPPIVSLSPSPPIFYTTAKWWTVEIRFPRRLRKKEVRLLSHLLTTTNGGCIGVDGCFWSQWDDSFPGDSTEKELRGALRRLGLQAAIRAAPMGRDCKGGCYEGGRCDPGSAFSCRPVFQETDWILLDPLAPSG